MIVLKAYQILRVVSRLGETRVWFSPLIRQFSLISLTIALCLSLPAPLKASPLNSSFSNPSCPENMVFIPGGTFKIGSDSHYPSERSAEDVTVDSFCINKYEITNSEYAEFVKETGYITVAERPLSKEQFPSLSEDQRQPGSLVFQMADKNAKQVGYLSWWKWTPGADWQHPFGPKSNIKGQEKYPVVQVSYEDVVTYAANAPLSDSQFATNTHYSFVRRPRTIAFEAQVMF